MNNNTRLAQRKSIQLKGYDYLQAGLYFITIVIKNRQNLFGNIDDGSTNILANFSST